MRLVSPITACALVAVLLASPASADTMVYGSISEDTTWTEDQSPYVLSGQVFVERDATLTIEPGVTVLAEDESSTLLVEGTVLANGGSSDPIVFAARDEVVWAGIRLLPLDPYAYPRPGESEFEHVSISDALTAIAIDQGTPFVEDVVFDANQVGVEIKNPPGVLAITESRFTNNVVTAVSGRTRETVHLKGNDFWNNAVNLRMNPQPIYDCGPDAGLWDIHSNDILLGPVNERHGYGEPPADNYSYRPFDVQTPVGSNTSSYAASLTDNWWGSDTESNVSSRVEDYSCCPGTPRKEVYWRPISTSPHTAWEPEGPVLLAYTDYFHGDPAFIEYVTKPEHGACLRTDRFSRIRGVTSGALGKPSEPEVGIARKGRRACAWWSPPLARFVKGECDDPISFKPPASKGQHSYEWTYTFPRPLGPGRYFAFSSVHGLRYAESGRNKVAFRIL